MRAQAVIDLGDGVTIEKMDKKKTKKENGFVLTVNNADGEKRYVNTSHLSYYTPLHTLYTPL